ncbi:MAG: GMC family oxidoreductase [Planctomycetes bacterium]|nr:GMC family oxidoreductase [Planctomycetota bacterium]
MSGGVLVIGSGASGVAFAARLVAAGRPVTMLDVGRRGPRPAFPDADLPELKRRLDDPFAYFIGPADEALILPEEEGEEYYGFPPEKGHVFAGHEGLPWKARGFAPLFSFAAGGLAEAWTGGSYPFNEGELAGWPFGLDQLLPRYSAVAREIGITGAADDLARIMPLHEGLLEPVELDQHGLRLLAAYERKKEALAGLGFVMGRARLAVLTEDRGERRACDRLGRCLWGCPRGALYVPSLGLDALIGRPGFDYRPGHFVERFVPGPGGRVERVIARDQKGRELAIDCDELVLAAGTLASSRIYLASLRAEGAGAVELGGLMDNRQFLMPFVNLGMLGRRYEARSYQYHQLAMGLDLGGPMDYVHGLVTTLKTAMLHPVVQSLPFSMGIATRFFGEMHAALGLLNVNFSDSPRPENRLALEDAGDGGPARLVIDYRPEPGEDERVARVAGRFRKILRLLGALAPKGMSHLRPMGASVHYAGSLPMRAEGPEDSLDPEGRSRRFANLWVVDGSGFPTLPAKNLTFSLMANARRVAERSFLA